MSLNPEFRRNLWLEMNLQRVIVLLVVLTVIFVVATQIPLFGVDALAAAAAFAFYVIAALWGTRRAANTVADEVNARTWDAQRMSALGAWSMCWGKLFGGMALVWMGALICLIAAFVAETLRLPLVDAFENALLRLGAALLGQIVAFSTALVVWRKNPQRHRLPSTVCQIVGVLVVVVAAATAGDPGMSLTPTRAAGKWFGLSTDGSLFLALSLAMFVAWSLVGAYRLMKAALAFRVRPVVWFAFVLFAMVYAAGFFTHQVGAVERPLALLVLPAFMAAALLVYVGAFLDAKDPVAYRWLGAALRRGEWRSAGELAPQWLVALAPALVAALILLAAQPFNLSMDPLAIAAAAAGSNAGRFALALTSGVWVLAALLFVIRDLLFIHLMALANRGRFSEGASVLCLALAYGLMPMFMYATKAGRFAPIFFPADQGEPLITLGPVIVQVAILALFVRRQWRDSLRPATRSRPAAKAMARAQPAPEGSEGTAA